MADDTPLPQVGHDILDDEHRSLMILLDKARQGCRDGLDAAALLEQSRRLRMSLAAHFVAEEAFLAQKGFSELAEHRDLHADMLRQVDSFVAGVEADEGASFLDLFNLISEYLRRHVAQADVRYARWLASLPPA